MQLEMHFLAYGILVIEVLSQYYEWEDINFLPEPVEY